VANKRNNEDRDGDKKAPKEKAKTYIGTHGGVKRGKTFQAPCEPHKKTARKLRGRVSDFEKNLDGRSGYRKPGSMNRANR